MRLNSVGFALSVGMLLIVVPIGFTLLSAAGLVGFAAGDAVVGQWGVGGPSDNINPNRLVAENATPQAATDTIGFASGVIDQLRPNVAQPFASLSPAQAEVIVAGDALFKGNCAQCHAINEQVVGPALAGIGKRRPMSWILPWVKNSSKVVASGDDHAVACSASITSSK